MTLMEYVTENGDTVEARGLTVKVELSEKTQDEIVSRAMARVQDITETVEKLMQALAEADAENAKLRELVSLMDERDVLLPCMHGCNAKCRLYDSDVCKCIASLMRALGIEVDE